MLHLPNGPGGALPSGNRLLANLPAEEMAEIEPLLERLPLRFGHSLYAPGDKVDTAYFVDSGMVSIMAHDGPRKRAEVVTVGREGMVGVPGVLGAERTPFRAIVQLPGDARRIPMQDLNALMEKLPTLRRLVGLWVHAHLVHAAQNGACNALHSVEQRAVRWLLLAYHRTGPGFELTQEFLAEMLGVRRPTISTVARGLQREGLISYVRGAVLVRDSTRLQRWACSCYQTIYDEFERVLPGSFVPHVIPASVAGSAD